MECRDFQRAISEQDRIPGHLPRALSDHMSTCASCRDLFLVLTETDPEPAALAPALVDAVAARLLPDLRPVTPMAAAGHFGAIFAGIFLALSGAGLMLFRPVGLFLMSPWQALPVVAALVFSTAITIISLSRQMTPASLHRVAPERLIAGVLVGLALILTVVFPYQAAPDFWKKGATCISLGIGFAIPAGAISFLILRRGAVMNLRLAGATAGLLAGLVGLTVLEIHCPILERLHTVVSHFGALALATCAGAALSHNRVED